jgi:hypothetical protein
MTPIDFDLASHTYSRAGVKVFGVTESLGLVYPQFDGVPEAVLRGKRVLGLAGHAACELDDLGTLDEATVHPKVQLGLQAWRGWKAGIGFEPRFVEQVVHSERYAYAGRVDVVGLIRGFSYLVIVDRKFVRKISPVTVLQTAGYRQASLETFHGERIGSRIVVQIGLEDGRVRIDGPYDRHDVHLGQFLGALTSARFGVESGLYTLKAAA